MDSREFIHMLEHILANNINDERVTVTDCRELPKPDFNDSGSKQRKKGSSEAARSKTAELVLYPTYDKGHMALIKKIIELGYQYSMIFHNKDRAGEFELVFDNSPDSSDTYSMINVDDMSSDVETDPLNKGFKKPHVHVVLYFDSQRTNTAVAREFGINPYLVKVWSSLGSRLGYQIHAFNNNKHQYDMSEICCTPYMLDHLEYSIACFKYSNTDLYIACLEVIDYHFKKYGFVDYLSLVRDLQYKHLGEFFFKNNSKFTNHINNLNNRTSPALFSEVEDLRLKNAALQHSIKEKSFEARRLRLESKQAVDFYKKRFKELKKQIGD